MTSQVSIRSYLNQAYLLGLLMVAVGLTLSPFLMGMSQFWLVLVWLVDGFLGNRNENVIPTEAGAQEGICFHSDFKHKFLRFWSNKAAVLLVRIGEHTGKLFGNGIDVLFRDTHGIHHLLDRADVHFHGAFQTKAFRNGFPINNF